jgi:surfactin synthase thioesterase subunit
MAVWTSSRSPSGGWIRVEHPARIPVPGAEPSRSAWPHGLFRPVEYGSKELPALDIPNPWFCRATETGGPVRLFVFPFAGGNAASFLSWQAPLGPGVHLHVALLPGRGTRLLEPPISDLDLLVGHLARAVAQLCQPASVSGSGSGSGSGQDSAPRFAVFGHSLGALVAFEVVRTLRRLGLPGPESLWVSGAEGPQTRQVQRRLHHLPEPEFLAALRDYQGTPVELLSEPEMMALLLPGLRADFTLSETYAYRAEAPLDLPIHLLRGDQDPFVDPARAAGWTRETSQPLRQFRYAGDHFFIHQHRATIAGLIATVLGAGRVDALSQP